MRQYTLPTLLFLFSFCLILQNASGATLSLSDEEHAWLDEHQTIRISGPQAFPPFQFTDDEGSFKGIAFDYVIYIAKMVGLNIEVVNRQPWPEILSAIKSKEIDLLTCAAITDDQSDYLNYTEPHLSFPLVIISRKDAPFISGLQGLDKKSIALTRQNSTIEWLKRDGINISLKDVKTPLVALQAVSLGKADATIENLAAATYLIEKNGLSNLKVAAPTSYGNYSLSIAIRKDCPELTSIINKALAAMTIEEHNAIRGHWLSVRYENGLINVKTIGKWTLLTSILILILVALFSYANRKLAQEIKERKRIEEKNNKLIDELKTALLEIKTLRGILPICAHCKKIRDYRGTWNQLELYIKNHSDAEFSHGICQDCAKTHYPELEKNDTT